MPTLYISHKGSLTFKFTFLNVICLLSGPLLSPQESVALLTQAGLFDNALTVASHFELPKETIFEGLASRYALKEFSLMLLKYNFHES